MKKSKVTATMRADRSNRIDIGIGSWAGQRVDASETRRLPSVLCA